MSDVYEHYKGDLYLVIFDRVPDVTNEHTFGRHGTPNREHFPVTVYIPLNAHVGKLLHGETPAVLARESREFHQEICTKRGCPFYGQTPATPATSSISPCTQDHPDRVRPRFKRISDSVNQGS